MVQAEQRQIDWSTAQVREGELKVKLSDGVSKRWRKDFEGVLALLKHGAGAWGPVSVTKQAIKVAEVPEGSEADLRHLLESIVLQVNSDLGSPREADADADAEARRIQEDGVDCKADSREDADQQMATVFRSFAESHDDVNRAGQAQLAPQSGSSSAEPV